MTGRTWILALVNFDLLARHLDDETTPLLRTDFSDDAAWDRVVAAVTAEVDFGSDDPDGADETYVPNIRPIAEREFEGATGASLAAASSDETFGYVLLADGRAMREAAAGGELTVVYVDLSVDAETAAEFGDVLGREFRCEVGEVASIEANLAISNLDFADFADRVDDDGVFRGFPGERAPGPGDQLSS